MNTRFWTTATLMGAFAAVLPARAADPQLLNLVMPDAKVVAGVNVDQAKVSPFGQFVLSQMQSQDEHFQEFVAQTGFDPTRDVHEVMMATSGTAASHSGLVLARGYFDPARITALALSKGNATSEVYKGVTLIADPKGKGAFAFLGSGIAIAGDVASVKGAIDRQTAPVGLPAAVMVRINQWSNSQDAWAVTTVPPSTLKPAPGTPNIPGVGNNMNSALQGVQDAAGGVKFGNQVVVSGQATAATSQDATQMGDALKLLASIAQMQANGNAELTALTQSLQVTTSANLLNVTLSLPEETLVGILKHGPSQKPAGARRPMQHRM